MPTITWTLNDQELSRNRSDITSQSSMLVIENINAKDGGKYECTAENEVQGSNYQKKSKNLLSLSK